MAKSFNFDSNDAFICHMHDKFEEGLMQKDPDLSVGDWWGEKLKTYQFRHDYRCLYISSVLKDMYNINSLTIIDLGRGLGQPTKYSIIPETEDDYIKFLMHVVIE